MIQRSPAEETQELRQLKEVGVGGSFGVLDALVTAIDNKDHYTRRHSEDVTHWASLMVRELGYSTETQRAVRICGLLHDVGKIAVPDAILRKPGRLNDDEFQIMQQHPVFGALIVKDVPNLNEVLGGIRHHHERYDGKGYPDRLVAEDIPMMGRLLAVPDCFSAMTTDRPYRKALTWSEALTEIERGKGTQFDPVMVDAFLEVIARIVADSSNHSLDRDGTRQSVVQLGPAGDIDGQKLGVEVVKDGEEVARPRSVMDADIDGEGDIAQTDGRLSFAS
jgi:putative nucleotidyltransferase with HDIG domain